MNIYIYLYDDFAEFETVFATTFLNSENIIFVAQEDRPYVGEGKFRCLPDKTLKDTIADEVDLFYIPGGDYKVSRKDSDLPGLLKTLNEKQKTIAGICGGAYIMADNQLLKGRKCTGGGIGIDQSKTEHAELFSGARIIEEGFVEDGHLITATGQSYLELACAIEMLLGITPKEQMREDYKFWKNKDSAWEKNLYKEE